MVVITAGVDVQGDRLEVEFVGWGVGEESWSIDYTVIPGDPAHSEVWDVLDDLLLSRFPRAGGGELGVSAACVDAGFMTQRVCEFTLRRRTRCIWAIKGTANAIHSPRPIWSARPSKPAKGKYQLYAVGVDTAKELIYGRLSIDAPGPGYCHFSKPHNDQAYFYQLTAERLRTRYHNGRAVVFWWKPDNRRNEALDCRVYALAALKGLLAGGRRLFNRQTVAATTPRPRPPEQSQPSQAAPPSDATDDASRTPAIEPKPQPRERRPPSRRDRDDPTKHWFDPSPRRRGSMW